MAENFVGAKGGEGVYRFSGRTGSVSATSLLPGSGGVAADPKSRRWAATQEPNQIYLFEGQKLVDKYRLPTDKSFYRNGLLSFGPSGSLVVATRPNEESAKNVSLLLFTSKEFAEATGKPQVRALFDWNGEPIADFVVGPPAQWQSDTKVGYKTPR